MTVQMKTQEGSTASLWMFNQTTWPSPNKVAFLS